MHIMQSTFFSACLGENYTLPLSALIGIKPKFFIPKILVEYNFESLMFMR